VFIDLTTGEDLSIVRPDDVLNDIVLNRPGLQSWKFMVFAVIDNETETTTRFMALVMTSSSDTFKRTILTIKASLSKQWTLKTRIGRFKLNPSFSKFISYSEYSNNSTKTTLALIPTTMVKRYGYSSSPEIFFGNTIKWAAFKQAGIHNAMTITSSYFCTQIVLQADEYIDMTPSAVKLRHSGRILEHGEFTRVQYPDGTETMRVCEEMMPKENAGTRLSFITFFYLLIICMFV